MTVFTTRVYETTDSASVCVPTLKLRCSPPLNLLCSCSPGEQEVQEELEPPPGSWILWCYCFGFTLSVFFCFCWVTRRHRGHSEAGREGHNDLRVLLLSRLLWCPEGELLTLQTLNNSHHHKQVSIRCSFTDKRHISVQMNTSENESNYKKTPKTVQLLFIINRRRKQNLIEDVPASLHLSRPRPD